MRYCHRELQDFVQSHSPFSPAQGELKEFAQCLESYLVDIVDSKNESEEHQKNLLRDFLSQAFGYDCNTRDRIDLAIYDDSAPKILFEVKSSSNSHEFVKLNTQNPSLESKAFYESILYFLRETLTNGNNNLTHIILTNTEDFYIIDAKDYAAFAKDKAILKAFKNCEHKEGNDASTKRFYEELKDILPNLDMELKYTHFRLDDSTLANCHSEASAKESQHTGNKEYTLPLLYQLLSPQVLLKRKTYLDANTLNQDFYDELLHILGLKESTQNSKVLIMPSQIQNTFLDSICSTFELARDKDFETLFSLLTTWNNRLLFLRLLESMLLSFKHIKKPFLDLEYLKDFQALNTLFFDILAKIEENRDTNLSKVLAQIPYLNSSLFEKTSIEIEGKEIKLLESKPLTLYHDSILYKDKNFCNSLNLNAQTKDSTLPLLEYLFAFLHAYDFTTTAQDIQNHTKMNYDKLINSAVLGLVFEKLNGYKEGSFYTPSFITRYMCKQSLERVVLQKFNEHQNWDCQNLEELKIRIDKLTDSKEGYKEANAIFDSIRICDPAVGSGHFLVSALNELILLKFRLGILCDEKNNRIKDITLEILRDEIVIRDSQNALFAYALPAHDNIESHKIQKALFFAKRKLIESCLFGVDINPNSCEITKLRLWIELLKYSYYKDIPNKRLETLPNIDINIKCGNSLISNIALNMTKESLMKELKKNASKNASLEFSAEFQATANDLQNKLPKKIEEYKNAVNAYKNETNADFKELQKKTIAECQEFITQLFFKLSNEYKIFKESLANYLQHYGYYGIDEGKVKGQRIEQTLQQKLNDYLIAFNFHKTLEIPRNIMEYNEKELAFLIASLKNYEKLIHDQNAFEWRFAFPEVLDSNGDFLGFDLVIGNPPYISTLDLSKSEIQNKDIYKKQYPNIKGLYDIYIFFVLLGLRIRSQKGFFAWIIPNKFLIAQYAQETLKSLIKNKFLEYSVDVSNVNTFERASVYPMIILGNHKTDFKKYFIENQDDLALDILKEEQKFDFDRYETFHDVGLKFQSGLSGFQAHSIIKYIRNKKANNSIPFAVSGSIDRYSLDMSKVTYMKTQYKNPYIMKGNYVSEQKWNFWCDSKIIIAGMTKKLEAHYVTNPLAIGVGVYAIYDFSDFNPLFILGILNSKFMNYCFTTMFADKHLAGGYLAINKNNLETLPFPKITKSNQKSVDRIIALVDEILKLKAEDSTTDTSKLESEIDSLVYQLYNLTDDEITIVESK